MTSNYADSTSYVSTHSRANDYTSLANYVATGYQSVPPTSLLKLTVAPGSTQYFNADQTFQSRNDNYRISPPSKTPISIGRDDTVSAVSTMMAAEGSRPVVSSDYASLGGGAYKMNPY